MRLLASILACLALAALPGSSHGADDTPSQAEAKPSAPDGAPESAERRDGAAAQPPAEHAQTPAEKPPERPAAGSGPAPPAGNAPEAPAANAPETPAEPPPEKVPAKEKSAEVPPQKPAEQGSEKPAQKPAEKAPEKSAHPEREEKDDTWIDLGHSFIQDKLFAPVFRVDRFFSDERDLEAERARSFIRWRNNLRIAEHQGIPSYTTDLAASLRFPGLNKQLARLQIEVVGQTRDTYASIFPRTAPAPGEIPPPDTNVGAADAGLALRLWDTVSTHADVGAGVTLRLPPGEYFRLRFRLAQRPGLGIVTREAVTGFWRTDTSFGTTWSTDAERPLLSWAVARLSATTTISEASHRFDWAGDASVAAALRSRVGAVVGWGILGATGQPVVVSSHRFYVRLRRDFYRRWIFFEIEPEYAWPWNPEFHRHGVFAVTLRAEFQFQGDEPKLFPGGVAPTSGSVPAGAPAPPSTGASPSKPPGSPAEPTSPSTGPSGAAPPSSTGQPAATVPAPPADPEPKDPAPADPPPAAR